MLKIYKNQILVIATVVSASLSANVYAHAGHGLGYHSHVSELIILGFALFVGGAWFLKRANLNWFGANKKEKI